MTLIEIILYIGLTAFLSMSLIVATQRIHDSLWQTINSAHAAYK